MCTSYKLETDLLYSWFRDLELLTTLVFSLLCLVLELSSSGAAKYTGSLVDLLLIRSCDQVILKDQASSFKKFGERKVLR